jgi:hypothetical protein
MLEEFKHHQVVYTIAEVLSRQDPLKVMTLAMTRPNSTGDSRGHERKGGPCVSRDFPEFAWKEGTRILWPHISPVFRLPCFLLTCLVSFSPALFPSHLPCFLTGLQQGDDFFR